MNFEANSLHQNFEDLVKEIFKLNGFTVQSEYTGYDFLATIDNNTAYVEVKFYRSKLPRLDLLKQAYLRLLSQKDNNNFKLILVVSSYVTPSLKDEIFKESGVVIWDAKTLFALAFNFSTIYYKLESILAIAFRGQLDDIAVVDNNFLEKIIPDLKNASSNVKQTQIENKGEKLYKELNSLKAGKTDAHNFEKKCTEILKYLFDTDAAALTLWKEQPITSDGLHRFDLLCRIISSHQNTFWTELAHDFGTRYVLFEFKNYKEKIKQAQIYTTEKYLFLTALRSVSFLIARNGAEENAIKAARGCLKETGKLIVILTNDDVYKMVKQRDKGEEPDTILRELIDDMLIHLTR